MQTAPAGQNITDFKITSSFLDIEGYFAMLKPYSTPVRANLWKKQNNYHASFDSYKT